MFSLRRNLRISMLLATLAMWDVHAQAVEPVTKAPVVGDVFHLAGPGAVKLTGRLGDQIGQCEKHRVWLPQPLLLSNAFVANTWKLTPLIPGPGRPTIPSTVTGKGK